MALNPSVLMSLLLILYIWQDFTGSGWI